MNPTKLDLTGLKCPLPALMTAKALKALLPGQLLEVHCTDPLSAIDIPHLVRQTGDKVEIAEHTEQRIIFVIEKTNGSIEEANISLVNKPGDRDN
jgi:tRNA 2-thiouridine synthesizing protein A